MSRKLHCAECGTLMAEIRDGRIRPDIVVYCPRCNAGNKRIQYDPKPSSGGDMPDFMRQFFGGEK